MPHGVEYCDTYIKSVTHKDYYDFTPDEIEKDTAIVGGGNYELPKCRLIIILLWTDCLPKPIEWSTLRRWTPEKMTYYLSLVGQQVIIEIPLF